jgi:hypothetical protein
MIWYIHDESVSPAAGGLTVGEHHYRKKRLALPALFATLIIYETAMLRMAKLTSMKTIRIHVCQPDSIILRNDTVLSANPVLRMAR